MSEEAQRAIEAFRAELQRKIEDFEGRAAELSNAVRPYSNEVNAFCEALRAVVQQQLKSDIALQRQVSAYSFSEDTVSVNHIYSKGSRDLNISVIFGRKSLSYGGNQYEFNQMSSLFDAISNEVLRFYSPF